MSRPTQPEHRVVLGREVVAVPTRLPALRDSDYMCLHCVFGPTRPSHPTTCEDASCTPRRELGFGVCGFVVFFTPEDFTAYRLTGELPVYEDSA